MIVSRTEQQIIRQTHPLWSVIDEMCFIFDAPPIMGKEIRMTDIQKVFEEKYGIDFGKIKLHLESEAEFVKGVQKGKR